MKKVIWFLFFFVCGFCMLSFSCDDITKLESITLTLEKTEFHAFNTVQADIKFNDGNLQEYLGKINWEVSDNSLATISQDGKVELLKAGTLTIKATSDTGISGEVTITILPGFKILVIA